MHFFLFSSCVWKGKIFENLSLEGLLVNEKILSQLFLILLGEYSLKFASNYYSHLFFELTLCVCVFGGGYVCVCRKDASKEDAVDVH